jgi:hypothetical protein
MDNLYRTRTGEQKPQGNRANTTDLGEHSKAGVTILKGGEIVDKLTRQEKIDIGLIRPYSLTSDRLIVEDLAKGFPVEKIAKIYNRDVKDLKKHIEKIKGEVKPHRFKGQDDNFKELYAAIFKKAAKDDFAKVKAMIYAELINRGEQKRQIHRYIDSRKEEIQECINNAVFREAQKYPETHKGHTARSLCKIRNMFVQQYQKAVS